MTEEIKDFIEYDDFAKLDIRIGKIVNAETIEGADKLLKITLDIAGEERTVAGGIAQHYAPEDIIGRLVPVLVNLKPRTLRGVESNGMILMAINGEDRPVLMSPIEEMDSGSLIR